MYYTLTNIFDSIILESRERENPGRQESRESRGSGGSEEREKKKNRRKRTKGKSM